jgi:deoxyribodipyrimidine photo-lyase
MQKIAIHWFRRDLRLADNAALYHALRSGYEVLPIFIFDKNILDKLEDRSDARVTFIHDTLATLQTELAALGSGLKVYYDTPENAWTQILKDYDVAKVFTNKDYEPYALERDAALQTRFAAQNIGFETYKDHVVLDGQEVLKDDGKPYTVFTPYSRKWKARLTPYHLKPYPTEKYFNQFFKINDENKDKYGMISLAEMGFERSSTLIPPTSVAQSIIKNYTENRDFPALNGTSKLGIHFRFGTISIRAKAAKAQLLNETFLNELIWRDFYSQILTHFPHVAQGAFSKKYEQIEWRNNADDFAKWCAGTTGYPLVDAGMRELNETGFMHNRVRMVVASFLTKHLLIDWRLGEAYFAAKLLDFDLASNNGGWQWAAGCGTDAAPYFRVFNPTAQMEKFDKQGVYVRKWVKEYGTAKYPQPMVEHSFARDRCLTAYKAGLEKASEGVG